jgi:NhaP-type Na+/H+ or K+/H+ antiporter
MQVDLKDFAASWHLPVRALVVGLPLTLAGTALLAHYVAGLRWGESFLVGAALSPTDPVFAAAIVGREEVPARLRRLLNIESGMNDGLAVPIVVATLALAEPYGPSIAPVLWDVVLGVALGVFVSWAAIRIEELPLVGAAGLYKPLTGFAIGILLLAVCRITHANEFLAAFTGGIAVAWASREICAAFHPFGELLAELFKLSALLVFGALIRPEYVAELGWRGAVFVVLALVAVRPAALAIALYRGGLERKEWIAAAWFGPKGFASVLFGILILQSGIPDRFLAANLIAMVVAVSIVAHSSTDVVVARWFRKAEGAPPA